MGEYIVFDSMKSTGMSILEASVSAVSGETGIFISIAKEIYKLPGSIQDKRFINKFSDILNGIYMNPEEGRKWSAILSGSDGKYAERIVACIDQLDSMNKSKYIINLSRPMANRLIDRDLYFRLCSVVKSTLDEDIFFIALNLKSIVSKDELHMEALVNSGLAYISSIIHAN